MEQIGPEPGNGCSGFLFCGGLHASRVGFPRLRDVTRKVGLAATSFFPIATPESYPVEDSLYFTVPANSKAQSRSKGPKP
jgi:hypothetical protein